MTIEFKIQGDASVLLVPYPAEDDGASGADYLLRDQDGKTWLTLHREGSRFEVLFAESAITEDAEAQRAKLDHLFVAIAEAEQSGTDITEGGTTEERDPFNPEHIRVHAKQFSLRLIADMISVGDIDLNPDFQRNLVWNNSQKSRLIESILLRIPLPMFYFSEDEEGKMTIVDGLQRLTTIKEFMDNKFALKDLEYLKDSCAGRYFETKDDKIGIDPKYLRWFNQTQFSVNVIDPSSPAKVKYDIFRRINTGGTPLNNQEIRNCLAGTGLRDTLNAMTKLPEFKSATDHSIRSTRMDDHEVALRFILFMQLMEQHGNIEDYTGNIEASLDDLTEKFMKHKADDLQRFVQNFSRAMQNAEYLFGRKYAFRKVRLSDLNLGARRQLINKALFVIWSVLLAKYDPRMVKSKNNAEKLTKPLAELIQDDSQLLNYLSYSTNSRANLMYGFKKMQQLIDTHLIL